jgi:hypothetical protein
MRRIDGGIAFFRTAESDRPGMFGADLTGKIAARGFESSPLRHDGDRLSAAKTTRPILASFLEAASRKRA